MQFQKNSWRNRLRTGLAQAAVWIGLCGFGLGSVPLAGAQGLDNITPPRVFQVGIMIGIIR